MQGDDIIKDEHCKHSDHHPNLDNLQATSRRKIQSLNCRKEKIMMLDILSPQTSKEPNTQRTYRRKTLQP